MDFPQENFFNHIDIFYGAIYMIFFLFNQD